MHINKRIAIAALLLGVHSFGGAQNVENQVIASQYGQFKLYGTQGSFNFSPAACQLSAGNKNFVAFQQGVPVRVVDTGTPSLTETVVAGPVSITTCAVSLPVTNFHASFYVTSGTGGLQEALNANGPGAGPNTVILDNAWYALGGDGSIISSVKGFTNLGLVDITQTPYVWYQWNGSQYVKSSTGGNVLSVFGRTGTVIAESGDYNCDQVTNCGQTPNIAFHSPLSASISASETTIPLSSSTSSLAVPGYAVIGSEWIEYTGVSGDSLTGAIRGAHQTTAAGHDSGAYAYSVVADFGSAAQAPFNYIISGADDFPSITVFGCAIADETGNLLFQFGCSGSNETLLDPNGAINQNSTASRNIFQSEVGIGPGGGKANIADSGNLFDSTRQNNSGVAQGFGAGIAPLVEAIQPPTIAAPTITNLANTGSTTWSYECTGTDVDGNTFPGTVASITNGPATLTSGEITVNCPYSAGAVTETIWRTAGGPDQGSLLTGAMPAEVPDTGANATPGTPPSTNTSVPKVCVGSGEVSCMVTSTGVPSGSCTLGWFDTNQSGNPSTLYQCNSVGGTPTWQAVGSGSGSSVATEFILSGAGSQAFAHNLNSEYPFAWCYTKSGAQWSPASLTPVDANDITFTSAGATDTECSFQAAPAVPQDFAFAVDPTSLTFVPSMSGTQTPSFAISQSAIGGYSGTATYSCTDLAGGMSCGYSPTTITGSGSSTLSLSFPSTQTPGTTDFNASATDGTHTHTQPVAITISDINQGLIEGWPMNDGSGASFANPITGNTLSFSSGDGSWGTVAGLGEAFTWNNTGFATAANDTNTNFTGTTPFSISLWAEFTSITAGANLVGTAAATTVQGWAILQEETVGTLLPYINFQLVNDEGTGNYLSVSTPGSSISTGTLTHICVSYNGSQNVSGTAIYINGVSQTLTTVANGLTATAANGMNMQVAGLTNFSGFTFPGTEGFLRIYNRALGSDCTAIYAAGPK